MTVSQLPLRGCTSCGDMRRFEAPPCVDGHGFDCPELACVECGEALVAGWLEVFGPAREPAVPIAPAA